MNILSGYKTYIGSIALGVLGIAYTAGWLTEEQLMGIGAIVAGFTGVSMRMGMKETKKGV